MGYQINVFVTKTRISEKWLEQGLFYPVFK